MKIEILYIGKEERFSRILELIAGSKVQNALIESGILEFLQKTEGLGKETEVPGQETEDLGKETEVLGKEREGSAEKDILELILELKDRIGIFGKCVSLDALLSEGDRIEIYRPLMQDPKEARRKRAKEIQKSKRKAKEESKNKRKDK